MAVYTDVAAEDLAEFLKGYDIGELLSYKGIAEGVENSNFLLHTTKGAYILTLYEKRVALDDLPYFLSLMAHLAERDVRCPQPAKNRKGEVYSWLAERPAAIINFLEGVWPRRPNVAHCTGVGEAIARMHLAGRDFPLFRFRSRAGGRCSISPPRAPTASSRVCATSSRANSITSRRAGRWTCRSGSSMPICFRIMSFSSATNCRG
jgi:homoserine kinase